MPETTEFSVSMEGDTLTVSFNANTIYGVIEFKDEAIARPNSPGNGVFPKKAISKPL